MEERNRQKNNQTAGFLGGLCIGALVTLLLACTIALGFRLQNAKKEAEQKKKQQEQEALAGANLKETKQAMGDKLMKILDLIDKEYYQEVDWKELEDGMFHGLMDAIGDPYSEYYSEKEFEAFMEDADGEFYGIGAYVMYDADLKYPVISKPIPGSPAEEAGLAPEDIIKSVNGISAYGMSDIQALVDMIKGEAGTTVDITILRGEKELDYTIERRKVEIESASGKMLEDGMAYIQITSFDKVTPKQFNSVMENCRNQGMRGLILDLRGNPGGNLTSVVAIARTMLPEGMIVSIVDKKGKEQKYTCKGETPFEYPLVVLIDGGSASAAELLSGAIQDHGIGTLVGTTSFGKGIVQDLIPLEDGTAIKTTTSKYYTPNGRNIHQTGIEPDIVCELDVDAYLDDGYDNQLEKAKEVLREKMKK